MAFVESIEVHAIKRWVLYGFRQGIGRVGLDIKPELVRARDALAEFVMSIKHIIVQTVFELASFGILILLERGTQLDGEPGVVHAESFGIVLPKVADAKIHRGVFAREMRSARCMLAL